MSGCTGVFIEFSMKCCSSNAVKHKLPTSEELRVKGSGFAEMHCSPRCSPSASFPCQGRKVGAGVHAQQGFKGTLTHEKRRTVSLVLQGWMVPLVLRGSNSSHMQCSPASAEGRANLCRAQQQPGLLVGLQVGLTLGYYENCTGYWWF